MKRRGPCHRRLANWCQLLWWPETCEAAYSKNDIEALGFLRAQLVCPELQAPPIGWILGEETLGVEYLVFLQRVLHEAVSTLAS